VKNPQTCSLPAWLAGASLPKGGTVSGWPNGALPADRYLTGKKPIQPVILIRCSASERLNTQTWYQYLCQKKPVKTAHLRAFKSPEQKGSHHFDAPEQ
jgi:hypothetical protein